MFEYISTFQYGRCVKDKDNWFPKTTGINRLYYINNGTVEIMLDNSSYHLKTGYIYLLPQNLKFEPVLESNFSLDHMFFDFISFPIIKMDKPIEINPINFPLISKAGNILFDLMETYPLNETAEWNEYSETVKSYLENMLFLMDKVYPIGTINDARIKSILEYIHRNFSSPITLNDLVKIVNLEKNYLIRIFRQCMDETPYQYIKKYRLNRALSLIKRGCPLSEVATRVGYSDISAFSHAFKNMYGVYPSDIR